jgi:hypothetical protein
MMQQNVKYDSLTGKVYEELGCPSKSNNSNEESQKSSNESDIKNVKNVNNEMSTTTTTPITSLSNNKESETLSHHESRCKSYLGSSKKLCHFESKKSKLLILSS